MWAENRTCELGARTARDILLGADRLAYELANHPLRGGGKFLAFLTREARVACQYDLDSSGERSYFGVCFWLCYIRRHCDPQQFKLKQGVLGRGT